MRFSDNIWNNLQKSKAISKELAVKIKENKSMRKDQEGRPDLRQCYLWKLKMEYRHRHIAYCEVRGSERHEIERPGENNLANEKLIDKYKEELLKEEGGGSPLLNSIKRVMSIFCQT
jgi:hypothetical protein